MYTGAGFLPTGINEICYLTFVIISGVSGMIILTSVTIIGRDLLLVSFVSFGCSDCFCFANLK
jgi:hypothetical protein